GDVEALLAPLAPTFERTEHPALHPGRAARVLVDGKAIGVVGELHPRWRQQWEFAQAPVLFELDLDAVTARPVPLAQPVPRHQSVERDIAVVVAEAVSFAALSAAIDSASTGGLLRDAALFDIYRPQAGRDGTVPASPGLASGEKSMAVRLTFHDDSATLTDEQVDPAVRAIVDQLSAKLGARLRG
ncbi:MAG: phenylalanine--tRNA ligase subunit beta, partial [Variovorax sp.]|nr:phenylalanine--tRNA ligase subunit beta [Variovorax sp.]